MTRPSTPLGLVADIGGTNARFALADPRTRLLSQELTLPTSSARRFVELVEDYLAKVGADSVDAACFAIAGPVSGDRCTLTNAELDFSIEETKRDLGLSTLLVVNDFAAAARSIPELGPQDLFQVGEVRLDLARGAVAVGPGTGLGVATILPDHTGWRVQPGEGGHVALACLHEDELEVVRALRKSWGYASAEMVLSGPGLVRLYGALAEAHGTSAVADVRPDEIVERALSSTDYTCVATLGMFCELLATVAANAALTTGATGGVFLAGGIVKRFPEFLAQSGFRERFTWHPHAGTYLDQIATVIVMAPEPGLTGALQILADHEPAR
ncbi:glucokinase [Nocardioides pocheonensis]|uniref:Glucokinase n=1 Tax=Nocardioides pocheonensis TaxID=661485 RepID=A0A3N0GKR8_9ACTN|nr:glucokinase [Nocardioides pocheonensis]RNM12650.1 glucokinase [Nocardioides pocheonensis]